VLSREAVSFDLLRIQYSRAARSVTCPKCDARPGQECESTGGGNRALVPTHKARWRRLTGWSEDQLAAADARVREQGGTWWARLPDGFYAAQEADAAPVVAKAKPVSARGVRLSEAQAEEIERAAANGGVYHAPTSHFHGDAQQRQSSNALEAKGILRFVALTGDGYDRRMELTEFGWSVYHQHRLIIHRVPDEQHPPVCPCRPKDAFEQVEAINAKPEVRVAQSRPKARYEATQRALLANVGLRDVTAEARGAGGAKVLDLRPRLAARHSSAGGDVA
jgi:hypothetical protein